MTLFPDRSWIVELVASLPGARAADQLVWGDVVVLWIGEKMFGMLSPHPDGRMLLTLKLPPDQGLWLREAHGCVSAGYHLNKRHWNSVDLDHPEADRDLVEGLLEDSYACLLATLPRWRRDEIRTGLPRP